MNTSNFINLIGRLGDNPKTVMLNSGTAATEFSLATNDYYRDRDGNRQQRTDWHRVKAYGKLAELFQQYLTKGEQISIVGSMRYRKWIDQHNQQRTSAEVIADSFSFISSGNGSRLDGSSSYEAATQLVSAPSPTGLSERQPTAAATAELATAELAAADANADLPF